jgi:hypothetical protein
MAKTLQTPQEVEKALGIKPGERLTNDSDPKPEPAVQKVAQVTQQVSGPNPQQQQTQPVIQLEQQKELTPDERAKMFQSKFSQEEEARKKVEQELALTNEKLNFVTNVMSQFQQPVQQVAQQPEVKIKEPDMKDFVPDYDPREGVQTTDPGYQQYLRAREDYRDKQLEDRLTKNISSKMEQASRLERLRSNAEQLVLQYPEYRGFNGEPNWNKIKVELGAFVEGGDLIKAKEFVDFKAGKSTQPTKQQTDHSVLEQIEQHAKAPNGQKIPSVTTSPGTSGNRNVELSEEAKQFQRTFGKL